MQTEDAGFDFLNQLSIYFNVANTVFEELEHYVFGNS